MMDAQRLVRKHVFVGLLVLGTAAGGDAYAGGTLAATPGQGTTPGQTRLGTLPDFSALDRNGDQQISKSEAQPHPRLKANFNEVDTDKDGSISRSEFSAFEKQMQVPAEE